MENILNNRGLPHLVENIFLNLSYEDLEACQLINQSAKEILENPLFWVKKLIQRGLSCENQKQWMKGIPSLVKNSEKEKHILSYLKWNLKNGGVFDVPFYTSSVVQDDFKEQLERAVSNGITEVVKILAPLTDNPNSPNNEGKTPIIVAKNAEIRSFLESFNTSRKGNQAKKFN